MARSATDRVIAAHLGTADRTARCDPDGRGARPTCGLLAPAAHLVEENLCTQYGVSRTPVRNALRRLSDFRQVLAQHNHELHLAILRGAASPRLYGIASNLARAPLMNGSFQLYDDRRLRHSLSEHREIVAAIEAGDASTARAVMEAHLRLAYRALAGPRHPSAPA